VSASIASSRRGSRISVGIGSWTDAEYKGLLYPKGLPDNERLTTYATWFGHVEVNSTYHAFPRRAVVENWVRQTPEAFRFDVKLHRNFSAPPDDRARLDALATRFFTVMQPLIEAKKLGAFLFLLPPSFGPERGQLEVFDPVFEKFQSHRLAVELRHSGWVEGEQRQRTLDFFRARNLVWVAVDMPRIKGSTIMPPVDEVTNPALAYLRLHGRHRGWLKAKSAAERHTYEYPASELKEVATRVRTLANQAAEVHVVANNHAQDFAPKTALALQRLLGLARERREPDRAPAAKRTKVVA
jgi:uncharacterized protein YecE (DUF72 family)